MRFKIDHLQGIILLWWINIFYSIIHTLLYVRLLDSLETFLDKVEIDSTNTSGTVTVFTRQTFALQLQNINVSSFKGQTFNVDLGSVEEAMNITDNIDDSALITVENTVDPFNNATAAIHISEELLKYCFSRESSQRLSYSVFLFDSLFRSQNPQDRIGSLIIAARLTCGENVTLPMGITTTFRFSSNVSAHNMTS